MCSARYLCAMYTMKSEKIFSIKVFIFCKFLYIQSVPVLNSTQCHDGLYGGAEEWKYMVHALLTLTLIHPMAALTPGKQHLVLTEWAGWAPELVWALHRTEYSLVSARDQVMLPQSAIPQPSH